jgi:Tol biopolymer transport system component
VTNELSAAEDNEIVQTSMDAAGSGLGYLLPALALAVLTAIVVGGSFLYQRGLGNGLLSALGPARIAFMSDRDGNWEVYIMDPDGANLANLTNSPSTDAVPVHRAGQDQLAFVSDRDGSALDVFTMDLDGNNLVNLTQTPDRDEIPISWSPGGDYLAFASNQADATQIFLIQASGQGLLNLSEREQAQTFDDWSPSADRFILSTVSESGISPVITDLNGEQHQPLTDGTYPAGGGSWSPDGQRIAFMAVPPEVSAIDIFVVDAAGGEPLDLTQSPSNDRFPRWSPDGSQIAFVTDRDGNSEIYVMGADGSGLTNLTNHPASDAANGDFAWSPDGKRILFHSNRDDNLEVYLMNADGSQQVNLTNSATIDFGAIWVE